MFYKESKFTWTNNHIDGRDSPALIMDFQHLESKSATCAALRIVLRLQGLKLCLQRLADHLWIAFTLERGHTLTH